MAKTSKATATAAIERIQEESYQKGRDEAWHEAFRAGWDAHASRVSEALSSIEMVQPRQKRSTRTNGSRSSINTKYSEWPTDLSDEAKATPLLELELDVRTFNSIMRVVAKGRVPIEVTVGNMLEEITLRQLIDEASGTTRPLGHVSLHRLFTALETAGKKAQAS